MDLKDFRPVKTAKVTPAAKKFLALLFFFSFLMFAKYAPYSDTQLVGDSLGKQLFILYFFIVNQTLGIVHEGGHGVCYILHCSEFITAANGTVFQLLFPSLVGYYYKRRGQFFIFLIGLFFLGISLHNTAAYVLSADQGPYLPASKSFLGVDALHDFNFILSQLHILDYNKLLAGFLRFVAFCLMIYSVGYMYILAFFDNRSGRYEDEKSKVNGR